MTQEKLHPKKSIVIVGGGFGGVRAALELSKQPQYDITLVSDREDFLYYPTLYKTATGGSDELSAIPLVEIFKNTPIKIIRARAVSLDPSKKVLRLQKSTLTYDRIIFAVGTVTNYFNIPGLADNSFGVKSLHEVDELKRHLHAQLLADHEPDLNYVIVGGGSTGVELAGELSAYMKEIITKHGMQHRVAHIDLIEAMPHLMPRLPKPVGRAIEHHLRALGVKLYLHAKVEGASADELTVSGKPIRSHTIVWTAGVATNPFFTDPPFTFSRRKKVVVDEFLRAEGYKDIYVIGDSAETPYSDMAQTAIRDAAFIVHNFICEDEGHPKLAYRPKEPVFVTPVGPHWASVLWGDLHIHGRLGWLLRASADLKAFNEILPPKDALIQWSAESESEDFCPICSAQQ